MIVSEMIKHANKRRFFMSQNFLNAAGVIPIFLTPAIDNPWVRTINDDPDPKITNFKMALAKPRI